MSKRDRVKAEAVVITPDRIRRGPPVPYASWKVPGAVLSAIRATGIDAQELINYTRAPGGAGFVIYYRGAPANESQRLKLMT